MSEQENLDRFFEIREYLDTHDRTSVDDSILKRLIEDNEELIRAEAVDFVIVCGGLDYKTIENRIKLESSQIVLPRLWLALALAGANQSAHYLQTLPVAQLTTYEQTYLSAANYQSTKKASYLYELCSLACSDDVPSSYSAIDLLEIVARDRVGLMRELVEDLKKQGAENLKKARAMLAAIT